MKRTTIHTSAALALLLGLAACTQDEAGFLPEGAVSYRLSVGYDEVAALKVFLGTLVGFYLYRRWGCLASGVGPPRRDGDVIVVGPVVRLIGGQRGDRE